MDQILRLDRLQNPVPSEKQSSFKNWAKKGESHDAKPFFQSFWGLDGLDFDNFMIFLCVSGVSRPGSPQIGPPAEF